MASSTTKPQEQDSSSSKRHFHWTKKVVSEDQQQQQEPTLLKSSSSAEPPPQQNDNKTCARRNLPQVAVARLRSVVLAALGKNRLGLGLGLGPRVVGTLFGSRRGHVHFAFQKDPGSKPAFLIELATPISGLVREMASGLVRIALECDKEKSRTGANNKKVSLLEESVWRTYCNGKKCGFATRRDCGPGDWKILKAVEPISMGAGVLPPDHHHHDDNHDDHDHHDEVMYMRAKFERIVGSRDSEAFYMMNPDSNGAPELSIYLLRL